MILLSLTSTVLIAVVCRCSFSCPDWQLLLLKRIGCAELLNWQLGNFCLSTLLLRSCEYDGKQGTRTLNCVALSTQYSLCKGDSDFMGRAFSIADEPSRNDSRDIRSEPGYRADTYHRGVRCQKDLKTLQSTMYHKTS